MKNVMMKSLGNYDEVTTQLFWEPNQMMSEAASGAEYKCGR